MKIAVWCDGSIQTHVIDTCNLNCKGCGHFANLFRGNTNCDLAKFSDELETEYSDWLANPNER